MEKVIIYGGAFNPPHNEHVLALSCAKEKLGLSNAIIIPSFYPPHKNGAEMVDFSKRVQMCALAFPNDTISEIEKYSSQKNYTLNTVKTLKEQNPFAKFYYLIGGDSMADFFKWYKPEEILKEVTLVVYPRQSKENDCDISISRARELGGEVIKLANIGQNISSAEIRALLSLGESASKYMPSKVYDYATTNDLYKSKLVSLVKEKLTEKTFNHVIRTTIWALELNRKIGLPPQKVFESAILHDIEKNSNSSQGVPIDALSSQVAHQFSGACTAENLGMSDEVVSAVKYHTTAKPNMSLLEMLVYSADMTEPIRDFDGVDELRELLKKDLEQGFIACLKRSYDYLVSQNKEIYHLTKDAYDYYCK